VRAQVDGSYYVIATRIVDIYVPLIHTIISSAVLKLFSLNMARFPCSLALRLFVTIKVLRNWFIAFLRLTKGQKEILLISPVARDEHYSNDSVHIYWSI